MPDPSLKKIYSLRDILPGISIQDGRDVAERDFVCSLHNRLVDLNEEKTMSQRIEQNLKSMR